MVIGTAARAILFCILLYLYSSASHLCNGRVVDM